MCSPIAQKMATSNGRKANVKKLLPKEAHY
jgi:hypothetical protein